MWFTILKREVVVYLMILHTNICRYCFLMLALILWRIPEPVVDKLSLILTLTLWGVWEWNHVYHFYEKVSRLLLEGTGAGLANPSVHSDPSISKVAYCRMHNDSSFRVIAKVQIVAALKSNYWFAWFDACCFQKVFLKGCWKYIIHELNKYVWKRQCFCS